MRTADPQAIQAAAAALRDGRLVAFPTETVYGIGANALNPDAVASVFRAKGRPTRNPLIVHIAEIGQIHALISATLFNSKPEHGTLPPGEVAMRLAEKFWPGPLTIVLPRSTLIPDIVTGGGNTVAIRIPNHPVALELLRQAGVPVAAPSANRSGELSPTTAEHVRLALADAVEMILDGGPCPGGLESTVLDLTRGTPRLLRPGLIGRDSLETICGTVVVQETAVEGELPKVSGSPFPGSVEPLASPGMLTRHYAPRTAIELASNPTETRFLADLYRTAGLNVTEYVVPNNPADAARQLYADLHRLDGEGHDRIIVTLPESFKDESWRAVHDRLTRACAVE